MRQFRGFTQTVVEAIKATPKSHPGGRLGRFMLDNRVSALDMADTLGVRPMTIYSLITGASYPRPTLLSKIETVIQQ